MFNYTGIVLKSLYINIWVLTLTQKMIGYRVSQSNQNIIKRGNNQACASVGEQIWEVCRGQEVGATHFESPKLAAASDFHADNTSTTVSDK